MNSPTSKQIEKVIENFERVLDMYPNGVLNMMEGLVNEDKHVSGTVHCHGGFYAIGCFDTRKREVDFMDGANKMANHLGFKTERVLENWANKNRELWGNIFGNSMFTERCSFTPGDKELAENLRDIIDHWYEVHDRVWLMEQVKSEKR